jgi:hypothetical protein
MTGIAGETMEMSNFGYGKKDKGSIKTGLL